MSEQTSAIIALENKYCTHNYERFHIVPTRGAGGYLWDIDGKCYCDLLNGYSANILGYKHPRIVVAATEQIMTGVCITSGAVYNDKLGPFLEKICAMTGMNKAMPLVTGVEPFERMVKWSRVWGYKVKKIPPGKAEIIVCKGNFHGRTLSAVSASSEERYSGVLSRYDFGPLLPGFIQIPFGDADALEKAITAHTVAFLVEPIQGEGGIIIPYDGYIRDCANICKEENVLLGLDEVQTGLGRTGKFLACYHDNVIPDMLTLGKGLSGSIVPSSLFLARNSVANLITPGSDGSTFGGNPLSSAVSLETLRVIEDEKLVENSANMGAYFLNRLLYFRTHPIITDINGKGLFIRLAIHPKIGARTVCEEFLKYGVLSKDTHGVVRVCPSIIVTRDWIDETFTLIKIALSRWDD